MKTKGQLLDIVVLHVKEFIALIWLCHLDAFSVTSLNSSSFQSFPIDVTELNNFIVTSGILVDFVIFFLNPSAKVFEDENYSCRRTIM